MKLRCKTKHPFGALVGSEEAKGNEASPPAETPEKALNGIAKHSNPGINECFIDDSDPLVCFLHKIIRIVARAMAVIMVLVIIWGIGDILWVLYNKLLDPPFFLLKIDDILATFGAFMAVMIAIELFLNITLFLQDDVIHVKIVIATALMAIARKVIVFDYKVLEPHFIYATGAVILALGVTYWLVHKE